MDQTYQKLADCIKSEIYIQNRDIPYSQQLINSFSLILKSNQIEINQEQLQKIQENKDILIEKSIFNKGIYFLQSLFLILDSKQACDKWVLFYQKLYYIFSTQKLIEKEEVIKQSEISQIKLLKIFKWYQENPDGVPDLALCITVVHKLRELEAFKDLLIESYVLFMFRLFIVKKVPIPCFDLNQYSKLIELLKPRSNTLDSLIVFFTNSYNKNYLLNKPENINKSSLKLNSSKESLSEIKNIKAQLKIDLLSQSRSLALDIKTSHKNFIIDLNKMDKDILYHQNDFILQKEDLEATIKDLNDKSLNELINIMNIIWIFESRIHLTNRMGMNKKRKIPLNFFHSVVILMQGQLIHFNYLSISYQLGDAQRIYGVDVKVKELLMLRAIRIEEKKLESSLNNKEEQNYLYQFLSRLEEETHKWQISR
ncbi:MAG: hypothetical protein COB02_09150 [Candidatus Cloacimonadota bacterium]|nr:MAG: hypothetical protein COB02_09150 [Candidatus Cloacimonadota bacterium]